jgi:hypothetical protein
MSVEKRTRLWKSEDGFSTTRVQFRTDCDPMVWMFTNIGWMPVGNSPDDVDAAESFATEVAEGYKLVECCEEEAHYFAGWED